MMLIQDLRYNFRQILRQPAYGAVIVATLAIGIGLNAAVFDIVDSVLLKPLPYLDPDRLTAVWENQGGTGEDPVCVPAFLFWKEYNRSFQRLAAYIPDAPNLTEVEQPETLDAYRVSPDLFQLLGAEPFLGRLFSEEEGEQGAAPTVLLSYGFWQRAWGGDRQILGKTITLDGERHLVVGVMKPGFQFVLPNVADPQGIALWTPLQFSEKESADLVDHSLAVIGRLSEGRGQGQAQQELSALGERLDSLRPKSDVRHDAAVIDLKGQLVKDFSMTFGVAFAAVFCVLLIACANVVNLMLSHLVGRRKEMAIREALGAGRLQVARQFLVGSLLLAVTGGLLGTVLAHWGMQLFLALNPMQIPRLQGVGLDLRVASFVLSLSLLAGLANGAIALAAAGKEDLRSSLSENGRRSLGGGGAVGWSIRRLLVAAQVTLAVLLTVGAALLVQSLFFLQATHPGFDSRGLLTAWISLPEARYPPPQLGTAFYERLFDRLRSLPLIEAVGASTSLPMTDAASGTGLEFDQPRGARERKRTWAAFRIVTPGYFHAMGIPLLQGRLFVDSDNAAAVQTAIINQAMADRYWPEESPIGHRLKLDAKQSVWFSIIGVVGSTLWRGPDNLPTAEVYVHSLQMPTNSMGVVVRSSGDPEEIAGVLRREVLAVDDDQPLFSVKPMAEWLSRSVAEPRFRTYLLGLFSFLALFLSLLGVYGVLSYSVAQRTHELGVRMALGADRRNLRRLVVGQGLSTVLIGLAAGLAAALGLAQLLSSLLFEVSPYDPWTFMGVATLLLAVALAACYLPAQRATRVDPMAALRN